VGPKIDYYKNIRTRTTDNFKIQKWASKTKNDYFFKN